jgi:Na+-transporting NADH:ubiquinone oxidoreductase subunit NqrA
MAKRLPGSRVPAKTQTPREAVIAALTTMPDEAFAWVVLAMQSSAMTRGGNVQIWPDGIGGFSDASQVSIMAARTAAEAYLKAHAG